MVRSSPTFDTLALFGIVYLGQVLIAVTNLSFAFVLTMPLEANAWTLATSVYAHGSPNHLLANSFALLVFGLLVERVTTRLRFHVFFLTVGAIAGAAEVVVGGLVGSPTGVLGGSGAVLGLFGYLLAGNWLTTATVGRIELSVWVQVLLLAGVAAAVTVATAAPDVALVAHFVGLLSGLVAGRLRLLHHG